MDKKITKGEYKDALNLISHLILTKPETVRKFLAKHGVKFPYTPKRKELVSEVVDLLSESDPVVYKDFASLISAHITYKGAEMQQFSKYFSSYNGEDEFFGAITAGLGIAKKIGGLFGRKKRRRRATPTASRSSSNNSAALMKMQMDRQMADMRRQQAAAAAESRRREADARRQREEEDRRRRQRQEDEDRRRKQAAENNKGGGKNNQILMIGGAVAAVAVVGFMLSQKKAA